MKGITVSSLTKPYHPCGYGGERIARENTSTSSIKSQKHLGIGLPNIQESFSFKHMSSKSLRRERFMPKATWLSKEGDNDINARCELSESANEDILIFFFQLDLTTEVQRALNMEQYEIAQELRGKLTKVEEEIVKQQEAKRGATSKGEAQDKALNILRIRADLQKAVENEDYALAAELRDTMSKLEAESLAVSAKALAYSNVQYVFRLGQKVRHRNFGYRAVICGMDPVCCESQSWMEVAKIEKLTKGANQPFYQVLVDLQPEPHILVAYVAEENLAAPDEPDLDWFEHPYVSFLFYGADAAGDFIPIKQLREKYNRPRHEIPLDPNDDGDRKKDG